MIEAQDEYDEKKFRLYDDYRVDYWNSIIASCMFLVYYGHIEASYVEDLPVVEREKCLDYVRNLKKNEEEYRKMVLTGLGFKFNK